MGNAFQCQQMQRPFSASEIKSHISTPWIKISSIRHLATVTWAYKSQKISNGIHTYPTYPRKRHFKPSQLTPSNPSSTTVLSLTKHHHVSTLSLSRCAYASFGFCNVWIQIQIQIQMLLFREKIFSPFCFATATAHELKELGPYFLS